MAIRESIYFSHDADAMNDPKCMMLISQMGMEGYGAFWALVELLRVQPEYKIPLDLIPAIAGRLQMSEVKLKTVISAYGLFCVTEDCFFFSQSLRNRMQLMVDKSERYRIAGIESGKARRAKALLPSGKENEHRSNDVQKTFEQKGNNVEQRKEKKGNIKKKDSKEKATAFRPPQIFEIENYCKERDNGIDASRFYNFYESKGWMVGKNKMKDWKAAVRTWETDEKIKKQNNQSHESSNQYQKL